MPSTKIINVLRDDKFEEILDIFRNTSAKEVIFVLPKKSKAFKNEEHFVILESEAQKQDKKISLLCSSPETNNLAKKYKFDVLLSKTSEEKSSLITTVNQVGSKNNDDEGDTDEGLEEDVEINKEETGQQDASYEAYPSIYKNENEDEYQ